MNKISWPHAAGALLLSAVLSGCAGFGPDVAPDQALSAEQLKLAAPGKESVSAAWWKQLNDPALDRLVETALKDAPSLKLAAARLRQARAAVGIVESKDGPQLDATANAANIHYDPLQPLLGQQHITAYTAALVGSWEFDFWGKNHAAVSAALGQQQAIAYEGQQTRLLLTQAVIAQYTQLQRSQAQAKLIGQRLAVAHSRQSLTQARINAGLLPGDNQRGNEVSIEKLEQQQSALQTDIERSRHALAALTGQGPQAVAQLDAAPLSAPPAPALDKLDANLLGRRPDIAAQRARVEAMSESVKEARAEFYPNVKLTVFAGQSTLDLSQMWKSESSLWGFMPAISLPIFHSGQLQANLSKQQAGYDMAVQQYNQTVLDALRDGADAVSGWQNSQRQLAQAQRALDSSRKASDAMASRLRAGLVNKLSLLDAQDALLNQQSGYLDAQASHRLAWAALNTSLGGGFDSQPATR
ncbi:efflux transporter outer membrane subunit [Chromobacterium sp. IIBBL 290-4]|uniref:efflux transporter outer membrane subunit n=1 Tax=Chromobacterium sp. IIBBL 290-4 TaxID=2953890 RepID=UPI0020B6D792|nr:efflux transporter outer membrane subunit [Chromobacterium sp. IIBBL 290-4]UTH75329.1 efflux transporter outer membrane subunit [Chromobacterium sp. IIBBL 290-4]